MFREQIRSQQLSSVFESHTHYITVVIREGDQVLSHGFTVRPGLVGCEDQGIRVGEVMHLKV